MPRKYNYLTASGMRKPRKLDLKVNGTVDISEVAKSDTKKVPLRIDNNTVILVQKECCNSQYAEQFKEKTNNF